jgi:hypothetical protein
LNLTPDARLQPAPESTAFDFATEVAKLGALAFPFLGTGIALFSSVMAPLRGKRLNDWLEDLHLRMNDLSQEGRWAHT